MLRTRDISAELRSLADAVAELRTQADRNWAWYDETRKNYEKSAKAAADLRRDLRTALRYLGEHALHVPEVAEFVCEVDKELE